MGALPPILLAAIVGMLAATVAEAKPLTYALPQETATLRRGDGVEIAQTYCAACHSVDYIATQPPKQGEAFWRAEVGKMIHAYHALIGEAEARAIADYLAKTY